jgi:hypothetical protein
MEAVEFEVAQLLGSAEVQLGPLAVAKALRDLLARLDTCNKLVREASHSLATKRVCVLIYSFFLFSCGICFPIFLA